MPAPAVRIAFLISLSVLAAMSSHADGGPLRVRLLVDVPVRVESPSGAAGTITLKAGTWVEALAHRNGKLKVRDGNLEFVVAAQDTTFEVEKAKLEKERREIAEQKRKEEEAKKQHRENLKEEILRGLTCAADLDRQMVSRDSTILDRDRLRAATAGKTIYFETKITDISAEGNRRFIDILGFLENFEVHPAVADQLRKEMPVFVVGEVIAYQKYYS